MKYACLIVALAAIGSFGAASPAAANVFPGNRGYGGGYYDPGGWGGGYVAPNPLPDIAAQSRVAGQQQAMQQNMLVQSGIRNDMMTQSQSQINSQASRRQQNKDWWFQYQAQQMADQRARPASGPTAVGCGFEAPAPPPKAAMDVIKWPALLQDPDFASLRTQIEAPYRRSPPGLSVPTADDYRKMVKTAEEMKGVLEWMTQQGVDTQEYQQAKAFLDTLQREARERSEPAAPPKSEP